MIRLTRLNPNSSSSPSDGASSRRSSLSTLPALLLVLGCAGLFIYIRFQDRAFRWASLDLSMTRTQAQESSRSLLGQMGHDVSSHQSSTIFWTYDWPVIYLEKSLGTSETNRILREGHLPVWGWSSRFFRPLEKEEYSVSFSPKGDLVSYECEILREKKLPALSRDLAREVAETFLRKHFKDFSSYRLAEESEETKPNRTDRIFRWKAEESPLASRVYLRATVSGDQLTYASREINIPQSFERTEDEISSRRDLLQGFVQQIDTLATFALCLFLLIAWRRRWLRWKPLLWLPLILFTLNFLSSLNRISLAWHSYSTQETVGAFWFSVLVSPLLGIAVSVSLPYLTFCAGDVAGRLQPHASYSLGELLRGAFYRSEHFWSATVAGFGAAGIHLGFVTLFYVVGEAWFGMYSPLNVPYSNLLSTELPWLAPLLTGLEPALSEESVYRLFLIPLIWKLTGRKWLSILLPAALWGFLHTGYYVEPIYSRGVELTLVGIYLGLIYFRFGIWATIVSHYIYNATVSSSLLLSSESLYLRLSSAGVIFLLGFPLIWSLVRLRGAIPTSTFDFTRLVWPRRLEPRSPRFEQRRTEPEPVLNLRAPALISAACLLLLAFVPVTLHHPEMKLDRTEAVEAARAILEAQGYKLEGFRTAASFGREHRSTMADAYLRSQLPAEKVDDYLKRFYPERAYWRVRFVRSDSVDQYVVSVGSDRRPLNITVSQDEEAASESLHETASRESAESFLKGQGLPVEQLRYTGKTETDRPHRKDVVHRWLDPAATVGDLQRSLNVGLSGRKVVSFYTQIRTPESFSRERSTQTFWDRLHATSAFLAMVALAALGLRAAFDGNVIGHLRNRFAITVGATFALLRVIEWANDYPNIWYGYDSAIKVGTYFADQFLRVAGQVLMASVWAYFVALLLLTLPSQVFPRAPNAQDLRATLSSAPWRWRGTRGAFVWALAVFLIQLVWKALFIHFGNSSARDLFETQFSIFAGWFPAAGVASQLIDLLLEWAIAGVVIAAAHKYLRTWGRTVAFLLLFLLSIDTLSGGWVESLQTAGVTLALWAVVFFVVRFHLPFYFWYALLTATASYVPWFVSGSGAFRQQAFLVLGHFALLMLLLFGKWRRSRPAPPST